MMEPPSSFIADFRVAVPGDGAQNLTHARQALCHCHSIRQDYDPSSVLLLVLHSPFPFSTSISQWPAVISETLSVRRPEEQGCFLCEVPSSMGSSHLPMLTSAPLRERTQGFAQFMPIYYPATFPKNRTKIPQWENYLLPFTVIYLSFKMRSGLEVLARESAPGIPSRLVVHLGRSLFSTERVA